eukprot:TRINITY_DN7110_c0_g1_i2.p1 TRINITY_DN7110_c0_g1~~TRINITY_DN7110_c0_g1_i2.p1  ORF type:complete len:556 (-),score=109.26 TRINITY_DN7110_c0_g1_i2:59-1726(-)
MAPLGAAVVTGMRRLHRIASCPTAALNTRPSVVRKSAATNDSGQNCAVTWTPLPPLRCLYPLSRSEPPQALAIRIQSVRRRRFGSAAASSSTENNAELPENPEAATQTLPAVRAAPRIPTIHDPPRTMRPGDFVDIGTVIKNWWSFPAVGFNSILEIPVHKFEALPPEDPAPIGVTVVPNSIFGLPIRKDFVCRAYWFHRRALAGYQDTMQMFKWEWPGSNKKVRSQKKSGKGRMGRRKAPGKFPGSFTHPLRPRDWRRKANKRRLWKSVRVMLSAKFVQDSIKVVDSFKLQSHKTKHLVRYLRRLVGKRCRSALLVHEGNVDVNDNFRWATAHVSAIARENVEGLSVYNMLKYHQIIFTEAALAKLITTIQDYPRTRGWGQKYATPDGRPAPLPEKVLGWNDAWVEKKKRLHNAESRAREFYHEQQKWKWSPELRGALKIPRHDTLSSFRVKDFLNTPKAPIWEQLESLYVDDEPLEEEADDEEFQDLVGALDGSMEASDSVSSLIGSTDEVETKGLAELARTGRRSARLKAAIAISGKQNTSSKSSGAGDGGA